MIRLVVGYKSGRAEDPEVLFCGASAGAAQSVIDKAVEVFSIVEIAEVPVFRRAKRSVAPVAAPKKRKRASKKSSDDKI